MVYYSHKNTYRDYLNESFPSKIQGYLEQEVPLQKYKDISKRNFFSIFLKYEDNNNIINALQVHWDLTLYIWSLVDRKI